MCTVFAGERAIKCVYQAPGESWLPYVITICGIVGLVLVAAGVSIWLLRSSIIRDIRVWELNRLKSRYGTQPCDAIGPVNKLCPALKSKKPVRCHVRNVGDGSSWPDPFESCGASG